MNTSPCIVLFLLVLVWVCSSCPGNGHIRLLMVWSCLSEMAAGGDVRGCDADADGPLDTSEMPCVFEVGVGVWLEQRAGFDF